MIYDAFTFYNELDLLEIRLNLLYKYVGKFILVEATTTHSGKPKPLYYQQNKKRYAQFDDKIIHIIVDDLPRNSKNRWPAEAAQRLAIIRGLTDARDNDIVITSAVDEIWRPEALPTHITAPAVFQQKAKGFYLNAKHDQEWCGSVVVSYEQFKKEHPTDSLILHRKRLNRINNGGWHWSYLGGNAAIRKKLESFAHAEWDTEQGKLVWIGIAQRQKKNCYIPPESDPDWPLWLKDNWRKYSHLVIESADQNIDTLKYILDGYRMKKKPKIKFYCSRVGTLPKLFKKLGFKVGVEVGVGKGYFSKAICLQCPNIKLYSVDAWALWDDASHGKIQKMFDEIYAKAVNRLSGLPNNKIIRGWSMDVVKQFANNSLDFVYIDAIHDYKNTYQNINRWSKKVRKGGVICGNDYASPKEMKSLGDFNNVNYGIKRAVNDWVRKNKIKPLFILTKGVPNWMYVK
ncbi:MAG: putative N-acetylglucosaminyltransferase [Candidatus Levybacteria bacterium]|nr:putative N-acetylglucosaminyltransferase [Candidatus Levybacteria bacterium]